MMRARLCLALCLLLPALASAQQRIEGSFPFMGDPSKDYSLYIPSAYTPGVPHPMMLGLHPLNTARWNSTSWCDTLIVFAETNGLILACPDGGADGRVDDPIDVAFTTALLDSMEVWYDIDVSRVYAMGFSWGGRATYSYGLSNIVRFAGFIPIGAAITGLDQVQGIIQNATGRPFYIVHGQNDSPNVRFFPIRDALIAEGAVVDWILMAGVGHTIDFPNRNQILTDAFQWVESQAPAVPAPVRAGSLAGETLDLAPNPARRGEMVFVGSAFEAGYRIELFDVAGRRVSSADVGAGFRLDTTSLAPGAYFVRATAAGRAVGQRLVVR